MFKKILQFINKYQRYFIVVGLFLLTKIFDLDFPIWLIMLSGTWSAGGDLGTARWNPAGSACGTQIAGLVIGGYSGKTTTEEYNGASWSAGGDLGTVTNYAAACGTQTAGLTFGGYVSGFLTRTEEYNGTSWSAGGDLGTGRYGLAGAGTQSAGLAIGGGGGIAVTEEYNGTSWSAGGSLVAGRHGIRACGTQSAGLAFGGNNDESPYTAEATTEEYDGTSWSSGGTLATGREWGGSAGTQTAGLAFGGNPGPLNTTEEYNGTSWSAGGNLGTAVGNQGGGGTQSAALSFGGGTSSVPIVTTEEYIIIPIIVVPTVTTQAATDVTHNSATGNGNITDNGGENCDKRGIVYSKTNRGDPGDTSPADSDYEDFEEETDGFGTGAFTRSLTGLDVSTKYYARAYAHNSEGYSYGAEIEFDTLITAPTVTTQAATDVTHNSATGNGNITDNGGENCDKRGIVYSKTNRGDPGDTSPADSDYEDFEEETDGFGTGAFTRSLTGLDVSTKYYARAYAHNSEGYSYGAEVEFDTTAVPPPTSPNFTSPKNYSGYLAFVQQFFKHRLNDTVPWSHPNGSLIP